MLILVENINSSETSEITTLINKYSHFLREIRKRILFTASVFAIASLFGFVFYENIIKFLLDILNLRGINVVFTSPFQFINLAISCGIASGLVLVLPLLLYQILSFLKPALRKKEYNMVVKFLPVSIVLFITGFLFGVFVMKWQIQLFLTRSVALDIGNVLDISRLLSTVLLTSVLMGVSFELPIIILLLLRIGIIKHSQLSKKRLWVYLGSFLFTIFLPADSVLADVVLTLPLILLFELTLLVNRIFEKKRVAVLTST